MGMNSKDKKNKIYFHHQNMIFLIVFQIVQIREYANYRQRDINLFVNVIQITVVQNVILI